MTRCPKCGQFHSDRGYKNCVINGIPNSLSHALRSWKYRVTFPSGVEVGDSGFGSFAEAFEAACVFIDHAKKVSK